jgi:ribosomal protein S12 methylthiotransferase
MKKFALISLGCPKNLVDSESFAYIAEENQLEYTTDLEQAELIIINTCGFIEEAREESVNTILETAELKRTAVCKRLIVTGCLVKRYFDDLKDSIPEIDELIELKDFRSFANLLGKQTAIERKLLTPLHYGYIRISDGCNNLCSYCAIPSIRGGHKSNPIEQVVEEAKKMASSGVKELIVTAQDTALYGIDIYGESKLSELLEELHKIEGFKWIRVLYLHPAHLNSTIIDTIARLPKVCKYFDIPLQHINNDLLKSMNRKVSTARIKELFREIKEKIPEAAIRSSFITGYPGESYHKFNELKKFLKEEKILRVGVFSYSREEGTPAAYFPGPVSSKTAEKRKEELMAIQQIISSESLSEFIGKRIKVIIDQPSEYDDYTLEGRSCFDAPEIDGTVFISSGEARQGEIVEVEIYDSWEYDLIGNIVK